MIGARSKDREGQIAMSIIDETHDPARESWVVSARGHAEFPIQNLPFGVFSVVGASPRGGVAIGDKIFDLRAGLEAGLFSGEAAAAAEAAAGPTLNLLMALGKGPRVALRRRLSSLLSSGSSDGAKIEPLSSRLLHDAAAGLFLEPVVADLESGIQGRLDVAWVQEIELFLAVIGPDAR